MTPDLFDRMLAAYEAWDPTEKTVDEWLEEGDWPISRQAWYAAMRSRGIAPKTSRRTHDGQVVGKAEVNELVELLLEARLRNRVLENRLRELGVDPQSL